MSVDLEAMFERALFEHYRLTGGYGVGTVLYVGDYAARVTGEVNGRVSLEVVQ